jgi:hypothetical protein
VLALVLLAAAWLQRGALRAPFFADDFLFLDQVRFRPLWATLTGRDPIGNFVRPVGRQLYFWLLARVGGESALVFHAAGLLLFLGAVALLFVIVRRLAGAGAAAIAAAFLALHYAADVPLLWASGSQDLLALVGALAALALFLSGRRVLAAAALLAALLSKETVLLMPVVAILATRRAQEPWRRSALRAWPLFVAVGAWAALWLRVASHSAGARQAVGGSLSGLAAAFVHLVQVAFGLEWRTGGELRAFTLLPPLVSLALAVAAVVLAAKSGREGSRRAGTARSAPAPASGSERAQAPGSAQASAPSPGAAPPALHPALIGVAWALVGALPIAAVAPVWSSYYYLFALCGAGLALGAWLGRSSRSVRLVAIVLLAWSSENGRQLDEFISAPGAWTRQSHVNRRYIERATSLVQLYLRQLKSMRPTLPPRTTVYFGGLSAFSSFQAGDGPLLRWAYRDSSLHSYYLMQFTPESMRRGPTLAFIAREADSLIPFPLERTNLQSFALTATAAGHPRLALDILELPAAQDSSNRFLSYWRGWLRLGLGDTLGAYAELRRAGMTLSPGPTPEITEVIRLRAAGDTAQATKLMAQGMTRHTLDPQAHTILGGLMVDSPGTQWAAVIEAYAATVMAPGVAQNWWLMAYSQMRSGRYDEARASIDRFFALPGGNPDDIAEAHRLLAWLKARGAGGEKFQASLHRGEDPQ